MSEVNTVVVGAGGRSTGWPTVAWAVAEALVTRRQVLLCHVCAADSPLAGYALPRGSGRAPISALELSEPGLARAVASARGMLGGTHVEVMLRSGHPGPELAAAAGAAGMLVIGPPDLDWAGRMSVTHYLVRHATCPLVVTGSNGGITDGPFAGHVVVGVDGSPASHTALDFAFGWADAHHRPVAAVHVTDRDHPDVWFDEDRLESRFTVEPPGLAVLGTAVDRCRSSHPRVPLKWALFGGPPTAGLRMAAAGARLLVVGGHGPGPRRRLGSVAHALIDQADCPVAVVHTDPATGRPVPRGELAGVAR